MGKFLFFANLVSGAFNVAIGIAIPSPFNVVVGVLNFAVAGLLVTSGAIDR
jgi:hypothetical protein